MPPLGPLGFASEQVYQMRETNDELAKLLGGDESNSMGVKTVFAPFAGLHPLQVRNVDLCFRVLVI